MTLRVLRHGPATARCLVVLLHGVGADADDLIGLAPGLVPALPGVAFAAFDGPEPCDMAPYGRQWFSLADRTPAVLQAGAARATPVLAAAVEAERVRLGAGSVALVGFSQGAMMALHAGLRLATPPAAILAYSGALLEVPRTASYPPILLVHGTDDPVVPASLSQSAARALTAAGAQVELLLRPGLGHSIDEVGVAAGAALLRRVFALG